jgi:hypothetical protein
MISLELISILIWQNVADPTQSGSTPLVVCELKEVSEKSRSAALSLEPSIIVNTTDMPTGDALCLTSFFSYVVECTAFHCTYALGELLSIVMSHGNPQCFGSGFDQVIGSGSGS